MLEKNFSMRVTSRPILTLALALVSTRLINTDFLNISLIRYPSLLIRNRAKRDNGR